MSRLRQVVNVAILALGAGIIWYERTHSRPAAQPREHLSGPEAREAFVNQATQAVSQATSMAQGVAGTVQQVSTEAAPHIQAAAGATAAAIGGVAAALRSDQKGDDAGEPPAKAAADEDSLSAVDTSTAGDEEGASAPDGQSDDAPEADSVDPKAETGAERQEDAPAARDGETGEAEGAAEAEEAGADPDESHVAEAGAADDVRSVAHGDDAHDANPVDHAENSGDERDAGADDDTGTDGDAVTDPVKAAGAVRQGTVLDTPEAGTPSATGAVSAAASGGISTSEGWARPIGVAAHVAPDAAVEATLPQEDATIGDHLAAEPAAAASPFASSGVGGGNAMTAEPAADHPLEGMTGAADDSSAASAVDKAGHDAAADAAAGSDAPTRRDEGVDRESAAPAAEDKAAPAEKAAPAAPAWLPAEAVHGDGTAACPADYPVKGNASSRIYHAPGRASYERTIPEFCFASTEAAERAGFRAPKH